MFSGVKYYIDNNNPMPTADLGGRKVLGMGGSLTGYINTGNQYHKDYYKKQECSDGQCNCNKKNKKGTVKKVIGALAGAAIVAGGIFAAYKTGAAGKIKDKISALDIKMPKFNIKKTGKNVSKTAGTETAKTKFDFKKIFSFLKKNPAK